MAERDNLAVIGWVSIFAGVIVIRFAAKGRGLNNVPGDLSDLAIAAISGGDVQAVLDRTGTATDTAAVGASVTGASGSALLSTMEALGKKAQGYQLGGVGPNYYDCSGLVYAAMKQLGYTGPRFTTATFTSSVPNLTKVTTPVAGDIVLWNRDLASGHMGVATDGSNFYSALSPRSGIKTLPIAAITTQKGYSPSYYRWNQ